MHMPKFDDEDEDDTPQQKVFLRNRKAVYKAVIKEPNGQAQHVAHHARAARASGRAADGEEGRRDRLLLEGGDGRGRGRGA